MTKKGKKENSAPEVVATQEEITKAVESLSDAQHLQLKKFAQLRIRGLGQRAYGMTSENLIWEAILTTLEGNRHWCKEKVDFLTYLIGAIRSISSHIAEEYKRKEGSVDWATPIVAIMFQLTPSP